VLLCCFAPFRIAEKVYKNLFLENDEIIFLVVFIRLRKNSFTGIRKRNILFLREVSNNNSKLEKYNNSAIINLFKLLLTYTH